MRHIGVDLHKTNFVACFIEADDTRSVETYPLTREGLALFKRRIRKADELAVEATQNVHYFYDQVKGHVSRVAVVDTYLKGLRPPLQAHGLNLLSAISLLAEVGDIALFDTSKQLASYAGLATPTRQSSETTRHGGIKKRGRRVRARRSARRRGNC